MPQGDEMADRILRAFLQLAGQRGLDGTTTRELARVAGVNEVTIFRRFGDKQGLARAALARFDPAPLIDSYVVDVDTSSGAATIAGVARCLRFCRDGLRT